MIYHKNNALEFAVDSNVHIEVISPQNVILQTLDTHNKATKQLVSGIMRFLRGEFTITGRRTDENSLVYKDQARHYIPCYVGAGTAGIELETVTLETGETVTLPKYDPTNRRNPPLTDEWKAEDNKVNYSATKMNLEITSKSRYPISVQVAEENDEYNTMAGDVQQIVFATDIGPGYYSTIYDGVTTDVFLTEIGLYPGNDITKDNLLAEVILKTADDVLYVRPQDTIVIRWTISIIALNDYSSVDEPTTITTPDGDIVLESGTIIDDKIPFAGTIQPE